MTSLVNRVTAYNGRRQLSSYWRVLDIVLDLVMSGAFRIYATKMVEVRNNKNFVA